VLDDPIDKSTDENVKNDKHPFSEVKESINPLLLFGLWFVYLSLYLLISSKLYLFASINWCQTFY
jgi:hypothetical protein